MGEHSAIKDARNAGRNCRLGWRAMGKWVAESRAMGCEWPSWCLIPEEGWKTIRESFIESKTDTENIVEMNRCRTDSLLLASVGTWRISKGIYRFNDVLQNELMVSGISGDIPTHVFKRLPEWGVYLEIPPGVCTDVFSTVCGAWVRLGYEITTGAELVSIVLEDGAGSHKRYCCHLSEKTIPDMVQICIERQIRTLGLGYQWDHRSAEYQRSVRDMIKMGSPTEQTDMLSKVLSALLYICSSEPDIEDREEPDARPSLARPKLVGKRDMFVAADRVRIWNVGDNVGEQIRKAREEPSDRAHTRRHLRRAHWHGYWTGARGSDERQFTYKWLSPMVVGVSNETQ